MNAAKSTMTVQEVASLIQQGQPLLLAGDQSLLAGLPPGDWIGGTIPYFMTEEGGLCTKTHLQVTPLPPTVSSTNIRTYLPSELDTLPSHYPSNGFSYIVIPAFSEAHQTFAKEGCTWQGFFNSPLVGWVAGFDLDQPASATPLVFNGKTGEASDAKAVVMHVHLPDHLFARPNILNIFQQGRGDIITFPKATFDITDCTVNGIPRSFAEYVETENLSLQRPLVANYQGAMVNVCFRSPDAKAGHVSLFGPVFPGVEYRFADPVEDYEAAFDRELRNHDCTPIFACNCILNYRYGKLEGKKTAHIRGPMTFGEIAYMLLNQTLVYLTLEEKPIRIPYPVG